MQVTQDRKLLIAVGRSRKAALWQNKAERDEIKDIGGFVGGCLKNGRRNNASVSNRCIVCLDADTGDADLRADLELTCPFTYALYSTHSHYTRVRDFGFQLQGFYWLVGTYSTQNHNS